MKKYYEKISIFAGEFSLPLFFVLLVGLDLVFRAMYQGADTLPVLMSQPIFFTLAWAALFTGIASCLPTAGQRIFIPLVTIFNVLICFTHGVLHHLAGNVFSVSDLYYAGDGAKFFSFSYLVIRKGLVLYGFFAAAASIFISLNIKKGPWRPKRLIIGIILAAVGIAGNIGLNNKALPEENYTMSWAETTVDYSSDAMLYRDMTSVNRVMSMCGIYQYLWRSTIVSTGLADNLQNGDLYRELDTYYASKPAHGDNEMTGILAGKNCFFVMLESIDSWLLTEDYMPNLYALQQKSIDFTQHYSSLYITASTFNTEFVSLTGQIPPAGGMSTEVYQSNGFPTSLAALFEKAGYTSNSYHSADPTVYNRAAIHKNLGFETYRYWINLGMDNYHLDSQLMRGFSIMTTWQPFFNFVITFSGHGPYTDAMEDIAAEHIEEARAAVNVSDAPQRAKDSDEYVRAVSHAMETDKFVGELVSGLEESGLSDDTTLIFFTDHYSKYMTDTSLVMELKGVDNMDKICHTPCFIYDADLTPQKITQVTSTIDIAPTVCNLFGLEPDYAWYPGRDIFSGEKGLAVFKGGSWFDGSTWSSEPSPESALLLKMSGNALKCDYFAHADRR